jgi:hypothetical protein
MKCTWLKSREHEVIAIFNSKCSKKLSMLLSDARDLYHEKKPPPAWIGPGETWTELCHKWDDPAYIAKCKSIKQNRAAQPQSSIHTGGSISSGTLRIRFIRDHGRVPTLLEMNEMLHRRSDGTWDSVRAKRANVSLLIFYELIN